MSIELSTSISPLCLRILLDIIGYYKCIYVCMLVCVQNFYHCVALLCINTCAVTKHIKTHKMTWEFASRKKGVVMDWEAWQILPCVTSVPVSGHYPLPLALLYRTEEMGFCLHVFWVLVAVILAEMYISFWSSLQPASFFQSWSNHPLITKRCLHVGRMSLS